MEIKAKYRVGRPANGEVRPKTARHATVGRPRGRKPRPVGVKGTFRLGTDYIALLNTISNREEISKSALMRDMINRLAKRFNLPEATYELDPQPYRPSSDDQTGPMIIFTLGKQFLALLDRMAELREDANLGLDIGQRLLPGRTQLLREEVDRYAAENGYDPVNPPTDKIVATP